MTTDALILPPAQKINMGLGDELREEVRGGEEGGGGRTGNLERSVAIARAISNMTFSRFAYNPLARCFARRSLHSSQCEGLGAGFSCHYELEVEKGYQIGQKLFNAMAESGDEPVRVFLPMFPNNGGEVSPASEARCTRSRHAP